MKSLLAGVAFLLAVIVSGAISWNWIKPESFGGALVFIGVWGILSAIFRYALLMLFLLIFEK